MEETKNDVPHRDDGDDPDDDGDDEEAFQRAVADLELIQAAYPDEVTVPRPLLRKLLAHGLDGDDDGDSGLSRSDLPLVFTLNLPNGGRHHDGASVSAASLTMEMPRGYPAGAGVRISDYRLLSSSSSSRHRWPGDDGRKARLDGAVRAAGAASLRCLEDGTEGALACCAAALEAWEYDGGVEDEAGEPSHPWVAGDTGGPAASASASGAEGADRYEWTTGQPLVDRKSTFQAHVCPVHSEREVREALLQLLSSAPKMRRATHHMYAWRIVVAAGSGSDPKGRAAAAVVRHDNDDDGEDGAGPKLAYLLEARGEENVLVVVSRWYGGVHLGPRRFAHIVNVARDVLVAASKEKEKNSR